MRNKNKSGSVLLFALIVMLLMGLMSAAIFLNTRSELNVSVGARDGREAFMKADAAAVLAIQLSRVLLNPDLGEPRDYIPEDLPADIPFTLEFGDDCAICADFTLKDMMERAGDELETDVMKRYLSAAALNSPHLVVRQGGQIVATAAVAVAYLKKEAGASLSSSGGGGNNMAAIMVTASGRVRRPGGSDADYFTSGAETPHSLVTAIYRDKVNLISQ